MIVYDATLKDSFQSVEGWLSKVRSVKHMRNIRGVLVANKVEMGQTRTVTTAQGQEFAEKNNLAYFECSAVFKNNTGE